LKQSLYDGEKTIILRREAGSPVYNPKFVSFITHYGCRAVACLPRRAQTKGKVERPFQYIESSLFNGRDFQDFEDLKSMARWWMKERSDVHLHETTKQKPLELFMEKEARHLLPLPNTAYDTSEVALRIGTIDGFIEFETNRYSIPYEYVGHILHVKCSETEIFVYGEYLAQIAFHERIEDGMGKITEHPDHRKLKSIRYGLEPVREIFLGFGEGAEMFLEGLKRRRSSNPGFQARHILSLKEKYYSEDIRRALVHANRYHAYEAMAIERILKAKSKMRTLESTRIENSKKLLSELPQIKQRSLLEYNEAFSTKEMHDDIKENSKGTGYSETKRLP
jgi:hypothetical protein